ncbi:MAG: ATP-binding protein [Betaproteobacteria bacterium]|nr:ATP-binding protein [Betaproteobacteria bacterium]
MDDAPQLPRPVLDEYANNPFIARLAPLQTRAEILKSLASVPLFAEHERLYPVQLRKHCILRLSRYLEPLERQLQLAERFDMVLRQGYIGRNPLTHDYIRHLQNGHQRIEEKSLHISELLPVENTASSFAIVGCSGMGKSKSIEKILRQYHPFIEHTDPFSLAQIVWLKLDCPHEGSPKTLCINFFSTVDKLIGTKYMDWYGGERKNVGDMMLHMAQVANLHALGVLVIDEIQHLSKSKLGPEALLNFLVTLVNTISVPVILIGTPSAIPLLQQNFRQARRASGLGSVVWDRMPNDATWRHFVDKMWQYVQATIAAALGASGSEVPPVQANNLTASEVPKGASESDPILEALNSLGVADDVGRVLLTEARAQHPSADPLLVVAAIAEKLARSPVRSKKPRAPKQSEAIVQPESDLRRIVEAGRIAGRSAYESLLGGIIKPPLAEIAA